ncbi:MAG: nuclear transport factor 2 family protein [candidate division Zixibacteria bacterium]|nr:nuclear transport factor 2 family protein [candidate division Zixibacteria bacterium]
MRYFVTHLVTSALLFSISACSGDSATTKKFDALGDDSQKQAIRDVLSSSRAGWNRGDLSTYMKAYWRDERVRHVINNDITIGYSAIEARYRTRYPDTSNMGTIQGLDLDIQILGPATAVAFGRWRFERGEIVVNGLGSLMFNKIDDKWVIVHYHSTANPE